MKRLAAMGLALLLLLALASCGAQADETVTTEDAAFMEAISRINAGNTEIKEFIDWVPVSLSFASLENLRNACKTAREGGDIASFISEQVGSAEVDKHIHLAELDKIYLPTNIPAPYKLYEIKVTEKEVSFQYLPGGDWDFLFDNGFPFDKFHFIHSRRNDDLGEHFRERLLEGGYWFNDDFRALSWLLDGRSMWLRLPTPAEVFSGEVNVIDYLGLGSVEDLVRFTEVDVIELG